MPSATTATITPIPSRLRRTAYGIPEWLHLGEISPTCVSAREAQTKGSHPTRPLRGGNHAFSPPCDRTACGSSLRDRRPGRRRARWAARRQCPSVRRLRGQRRVLVLRRSSRTRPARALATRVGPNLLGGTNIVRGINSFVSNLICSGNTYSYRADTEQALSWITATVAAEGASLSHRRKRHRACPSFGARPSSLPNPTSGRCTAGCAAEDASQQDVRRGRVREHRLPPAQHDRPQT